MMKNKMFLSLLIGAAFLGGDAQAGHLVKSENITPLSSSIVQVSASKQEVGAQNFIAGMTDRALGFLSNSNLSHDQRKKEFRSLLNSSFDMNTIARFTLGRYWRNASKAQQKEYLKLFKEMIIEVYSNRFGEYNGQQIEVIGSLPKGKSDVIVNSKIIQQSGPAIKLDWRVRYKNGKYKIVDVIVEGVSMALTQRSDFASVIQRGGGDVEVLIAHLKER